MTYNNTPSKITYVEFSSPEKPGPSSAFYFLHLQNQRQSYMFSKTRSFVIKPLPGLPYNNHVLFVCLLLFGLCTTSSTIRRRAPALATSPSNNYAPVRTNCPEDFSVRLPNSVRRLQFFRMSGGGHDKY